MRLIINADDFGRSTEINRAVLRAHREGVLNSASLMIAGEAADEAVEMARQNPSLSVGLHVVAVDGPAVLGAERIPHLVDSEGRFPNAPARLGLRYAFSRAAKRELSAELSAQFEAFAATGLPLSHVDGHQHMHLHPAVFDGVVPLARQFGARRIRVVRDNFRLAFRFDRRLGVSRTLISCVFGVLAARCRSKGFGRGRERTYGFLRSGAMTEAYVLSVIQELNDSDEIYFHPTEGERLNLLGPNRGDLEALLSPAVCQALKARQFLNAPCVAGHASEETPAVLRSELGPVASK